MSAPSSPRRARPTRARLIGVVATAAVIACALACTACGRGAGDGPSAGTSSIAKPTAFPRTIRDAAGVTLTIPAKPQRIVSQTLGTDEILFAICPPTRIVGVSTFARDGAYSHVVDAVRAAGQPAIDSTETVIGLKPDLIFVASYSRADLIEVLRASGAPVFRFSNFDRIADIMTNIRTVAYAIGEDAAAEQLVADMEARLARVRARAAASGRRPRVMSYDGTGYTAGSDTLFDDVIRVAGGVNAAAASGAKGFMRVGGEQMLSWKPDYLIVGAKPGEEEIVRRRMLANPAVASSDAVKGGRLVLMDTRIFLTTSQHVVSAAEALADALHGPEAPR